MSSNIARPHLAIVAVFIVLGAVGSQLGGCADQTSRHELPSARQLSPLKQGDILVALKTFDSIQVEPEHVGDYRREDWPHWRQGRSKCISVREEVLITESKTPVALSADGCVILSGHWVDAYTGQTITDPKQLDVDHLVPLEEVNQSGGWAWDKEQRAAYANDLTDQRTLIAVSAAANRSKGAKGPEEWLPPYHRHECIYVAHWVMIKAKWDLNSDQREYDAVRNLLIKCQHSLAN